MTATDTTDFLQGQLVIYDLRDPQAWRRAHRERAAWGRLRSEIHPLGNDHVVIEYRPGGDLEDSE
jgi:hypothetical protein